MLRYKYVSKYWVLGIGDPGDPAQVGDRGWGSGINPAGGSRGSLFYIPAQSHLNITNVQTRDVLHLVKMIYTLTPPSGTGIAWRGEQGPEGSIPAGAVTAREGGREAERGPGGRLGCSAPGSAEGGGARSRRSARSSLIYTYSPPISNKFKMIYRSSRFD